MGMRCCFCSRYEKKKKLDMLQLNSLDQLPFSMFSAETTLSLSTNSPLFFFYNVDFCNPFLRYNSKDFFFTFFVLPFF